MNYLNFRWVTLEDTEESKKNHPSALYNAKGELVVLRVRMSGGWVINPKWKRFPIFNNPNQKHIYLSKWVDILGEKA